MENHIEHKFLIRDNSQLMILLSTFICLISSYLICLNLQSNIFYHTDAFAPIQQIILLVNFKSVSLADLHLARIPSLLPDLTIIYFIVKLLREQDLFVIQAIYSFVLELLYLLGTISILFILYKSKFNLLFLSLIVSIVNFTLLKLCPLYREAFGYFLTPVHQGGNIIMTIIFINLILLYNKNLQYSERYGKLFCLCFTIIVALSIVSNKLFIFTALLPFLIVKLLDRLYIISKFKSATSIFFNALILLFVVLSTIIFASGVLGIVFQSRLSFSLLLSIVFQLCGFIIAISSISLFVFDKDYILTINTFNINSVYHFYSSFIRSIQTNIQNNPRFRYLVFILCPVFLVICVLSFQLNTQCMYPINIDIRSKLLEFMSLLNSSKLLAMMFITYFLIVFLCIDKNIFLKAIKKSRMYFGCRDYSTILQQSNTSRLHLCSNSIFLFISLSGLSPLIYLWLAEGVYIRYMLITFLFFPLTIAVLLLNLIINFTRLFNKFNISSLFNLFVMIIFVLTLMITLPSNNIIIPNNSFTKWPVNQKIKADNPINFLSTFILSKSLRRSALFSKSDFAIDHLQINSLDLQNGLSDYWGSSVSELGISKMNVLPVLPNGKPNFWSHSSYNYRSNLNDFLKFNFVYSRSIEFTTSILNAYGIPDKIYQLDKDDINPIIVEPESINSDYRYILFYSESSKGWHNIQDRIYQKTTKYDCQ